MKKFIICGLCGNMGKNLLELLKGDDCATVLCGVDLRPAQSDIPVYSSFKQIDFAADAVIDFSSPAALYDELEYCQKFGVPAVLASTGYSEEHLAAIREAAKKIPVFKTANFSLGINLLVELVNRAAKVLGDKFDVEIIEKHHSQKKDAPSGTALMLAESVNSAFDEKKPYVNGRCGIVGKRGNEIGIHAVRGGTIVGDHDVMFCGEDEIITISHTATSKKVFAAGAIKAAKWIVGKPAGTYGMQDVLKEEL